MEPMTMEELAAELRKKIQDIKEEVAGLHAHDCFQNENCHLADGNVPPDQQGNMHANITLVFRHLEDARMRLGKVMQAHQGGVSILDK